MVNLLKPFVLKFKFTIIYRFYIGIYVYLFYLIHQTLIMLNNKIINNKTAMQMMDETGVVRSSLVLLRLTVPRKGLFLEFQYYQWLTELVKFLHTTFFHHSWIRNSVHANVERALYHYATK